MREHGSYLITLLKFHIAV